jgi:hypothetical protein
LDQQTKTTPLEIERLINWLAELKRTKTFPIDIRPTDWFIDHIMAELAEKLP